MILLGKKKFVKGSSDVIIVPSLTSRLGTIDSTEVRTLAHNDLFTSDDVETSVRSSESLAG